MIYTIPDTEIKPDNNRYMSIDLGVNNLVTITSNIKGVNPIIINGRPLKSINQFYNKRLSHYQSILEKRNHSKNKYKN